VRQSGWLCAAALLCGCTPSGAGIDGGDTVISGGDLRRVDGDAFRAGDGGAAGDSLSGGDANLDPCDAPYAFWDLLDAVDAAVAADRQGIVDAWITAHGPDLPYRSGQLVTFLYRGAATDAVYLAGDSNGWSATADPMSRIADTDVFQQSWCLPADARIDYKFVVNGTWILDPANPHTIDGGFGTNSELRMPEWVYPAEIDYDPAVPHGSINGTTVAPGAAYNGMTFDSAVLGNSRDFWIYLPPGYSSGGSYPTLYVHDGGEYIGIARMPNVLDNLLAAGRIEPLIVVFVNPVDRNAEYVGAQIPGFVNMVATELVPYIDSQYATDTSAPARRGVMGTSNGGYISMRIGRDHPELFGRIGSQSGALRADGGGVIASYAGGTLPAGVEVYLDCGLIDDFTTANRSMRDALAQAGYLHSYTEYPEGHSWGNWRAHVDELLPFLFAP